MEDFNKIVWEIANDPGKLNWLAEYLSADTKFLGAYKTHFLQQEIDSLRTAELDLKTKREALEAKLAEPIQK